MSDSWGSRTGPLAILGGVLWLLLVGFGLRAVLLDFRSQHWVVRFRVPGARDRDSSLNSRGHIRPTHARPQQSRPYGPRALRRHGRCHVSGTGTSGARQLGVDPALNLFTSDGTRAVFGLSERGVSPRLAPAPIQPHVGIS